MNMSNGMAVQVQDLEKKYGEIFAIGGDSFEIKE